MHNQKKKKYEEEKWWSGRHNSSSSSDGSKNNKIATNSMFISNQICNDIISYETHIVWKMKTENCVKRCNSSRAALCLWIFLCVRYFFSRRLSIGYVSLFILFCSFEPDFCRYSLLFFSSSSSSLHTSRLLVWLTFDDHSVGVREHATHTLNHHSKCSKPNCLHSMIYHNYYYWNSSSDTCGVAVLHYIHFCRR